MMDWIAGLGDILSSGGLGAIIGVVGAMLQKREERKKQAQDNEHKYRMAELDIKSKTQEHEHALALADKQIDIAETEGKLEREQAELEGQLAIKKLEAEAFKDSLVVGNQKTGTGFDKFLSAMRPAITIVLLVSILALIVMVWLKIHGLDALGSKELVDLFKQLVNQTVFLAVTAVLWWFGARPAQTRPKVPKLE